MYDNLLDNSKSEEATNTASQKRGNATRVIRALFKKSFLIKIRRPASIFEFLFACIVWLILIPAWKLGRVNFEGSRNPQLNYTSIIPQRLIMFFLVTKNSSLVFLPDCYNTRSLYKLWNDSISIIGINYTNITFDAQFVNSVEKMKTIIYSQTSNGYGVYWSNAREKDALISPKIETYRQSFGFSPDDELFELVYRSIAYMNGQFVSSSILMTNTSYQEFAAVDSEMILDMSVFVAIIVVLPVIVSTMPDLQMILVEKDTRIMTLSFLMGCKESYYWFVSFMMQLIMSFFPYLLMSLYFCFGGILKGTSFSLLMLINVLFIMSHVWFLLFFTTFMRKASSSRMLVAIFMFLGVFFAYLHYFFTLDDSNHSRIVKHVFSIVPISCYQLALMSLYQQSRASMPPASWSNIFGSKMDHLDLKYSPAMSLLWLSIDAILYFLLFVLFDLFYPRAYGSPPFSIKRIMSKRKSKNKKMKSSNLYIDESSASVASLLTSPQRFEANNNFLLKVDGLSKIYSGDRKIVALDDVCFEIEQNEVVVVIGPNGAGKSTLINILAGAIEPSQGNLQINDNNQSIITTTRFADLQSILGCCFQENVLIDLLTVDEHFYLFGAFRGVEIDKLKEIESFYLNTLKLDVVVNSRATDLSGGQKRKLCVALSLIGEPKLVIMDEPTAGVDVQSRQLIWKTISSLKKTTTIVTSHALEEAEAVSSRLFVVSKGKIPFTGSATELRKRFKCGYVLRVEGNINNVLNLANQCNTNASLSSDRNDTLEIPISNNVANFMELLDEKKTEIGVSTFSFSVEQLEDVLLRIIQNDEAGFDNTN